MDRGERRKRRKRKIKQRLNLVNSITKYCYFIHSEEGYYNNNNEMNIWGNAGIAKKTKTKNTHSSYRHKGGFGSAIKYSSHDLKQVQDMDNQEKYYDL